MQLIVLRAEVVGGTIVEGKEGALEGEAGTHRQHLYQVPGEAVSYLHVIAISIITNT
jgi:hypothetical protein